MYTAVTGNITRSHQRAWGDEKRRRQAGKGVWGGKTKSSAFQSRVLPVRPGKDPHTRLVFCNGNPRQHLVPGRHMVYEVTLNTGRGGRRREREREGEGEGGEDRNRRDKKKKMHRKNKKDHGSPHPMEGEIETSVPKM